MDTRLFAPVLEEHSAPTSIKFKYKKQHAIAIAIIGIAAVCIQLAFEQATPPSVLDTRAEEKEFVRELLVEEEIIRTFQTITSEALTLIAIEDLDVLPGLDALTVGALSKGIIDLDRVRLVRKDIKAVKELNFAWPAEEDLTELLENAAMDVLALQLVGTPIRNLSLTGLSTLISLEFLDSSAIGNLLELDYLTLERIDLLDAGTMAREAIKFKLLEEAGLSNALDTEALFEDARALGTAHHSAEDLELIDNRVLLVDVMTTIGVVSTTREILSWKLEERKNYIEGMKRRWTMLKQKDDSLTPYLL